MNEPYNWFKTMSKRSPTDLEALSMSLTSKGKVTVYTCTILDCECNYVPKTGAGDCRRCNFALTYLTAHPEEMRGKKE